MLLGFSFSIFFRLKSFLAYRGVPRDVIIECLCSLIETLQNIFNSRLSTCEQFSNILAKSSERKNQITLQHFFREVLLKILCDDFANQIQWHGIAMILQNIKNSLLTAKKLTFFLK
jgi:hypothetical protein